MYYPVTVTGLRGVPRAGGLHCLARAVAMQDKK